MPYESYSPADDDRFSDSVNFVSSTTVASVAYGVMFTLYFICLYFLKSQMKSKRDKALSISLISYITLMFSMGTIYIGTKTQENLESYVFHSTFPSGPSFYDNSVLLSAPIGILNNASYKAANWLADALLLWRLFVMFRGSPYRVAAVAFPSLIYLGSLVTGLVYIVQTSLPHGSLGANGKMDIAMPYFVLSVTLSITATTFMILRMLFFKQEMHAILGKTKGLPYTSIVVMLVESCALHAVFAIAFITLYALNHPLQYVCISALANVQIIAALLIIFRVSQNKAWESRGAKEVALSSLKFGSMGQRVAPPGNSHQDEEFERVGDV